MVGRQIAVLRKAAGLTQTDLARLIHVSPSTVGMYEQGRRLPVTPTLMTLSQVFDVSIDYLVTGEPCSPKDLKGICTMIKRGVRKVGTAYADSVGQMPANYRLMAEFYHHIAE
jgi:transcriptional regulator with XRE-family HTH domain